eukprot:234765_1
MGQCSDTQLEDEHIDTTPYYTTATSRQNVLNQPLSKPTQLPRNGTVSAVQRDKYEEAKQMMSYPSYRNVNAVQRSIHSEASIATLSDKLDLNFSLRNIPKLDYLSPSDPFIVVSVKDEVHNRYNVVGKTEIVWDNPHPDFSKDIRINYLFEEVQYVRLDMYDADEHQTVDLSKHDYIGTAEFVVGDLVTTNGQKIVMEIRDRTGKKLKKVKGSQPLVIVRAQEIDDNCDEIEFLFSAVDLPKMDVFGKIDGFFQIYRQTNDGQWASVYTSEHVANSYTPNWKKFTIESRRLCHGDMNRPILIKCFDWNRDALPDYACDIKTTLAQLIDCKRIRWQQWDAKKRRYKNKKCGELLIKHANIIKKYPFVSYLKGGLELQLTVAIDFTGSNGDPRSKKSLHYMGPPHYESQYMKVIKSVGRVLEPYDADGAIGAYGFGANLNPMGKNISHCFNLTLRPDGEEVDGIDGVCEAYKNCLNKVQLYGPTYFSEIISNAAAKSVDLCSQNEQSYNILLIITDGVINDMQRTTDAIVDATLLPLSIIIVGVGDANFDNMDILDADDTPLRHSRTGRYMKRDIVQFVPFNEFKTQHISAVARETLEEIPGQVTSFMSMHNIHPNPPPVEASRDAIYGGPNDANLYANVGGVDSYTLQPTAPMISSGSIGKEGAFTAPGNWTVPGQGH